MKPIFKPPKMNKLESRYADTLEKLKLMGEIVDWRFEAVRLKLGAGAYYKPDFLVVKKHCFEFHETKGFWREAARVRIKAAALLYPWFKIYAVQFVNNAWEYEEF